MRKKIIKNGRVYTIVVPDEANAESGLVADQPESNKLKFPHFGKNKR